MYAIPQNHQYNINDKNIKSFEKRINRLRIRNENTEHINRKIYYLLCDPQIYINSYGNICRNKGALTLGISTNSLFKISTEKRLKP